MFSAILLTGARLVTSRIIEIRHDGSPESTDVNYVAWRNSIGSLVPLLKPPTLPTSMAALRTWWNPPWTQEPTENPTAYRTGLSVSTTREQNMGGWFYSWATERWLTNLKLMTSGNPPDGVYTSSDSYAAVHLEMVAQVGKLPLPFTWRFLLKTGVIHLGHTIDSGEYYESQLYTAYEFIVEVSRPHVRMLAFPWALGASGMGVPVGIDIMSAGGDAYLYSDRPAAYTTFTSAKVEFVTWAHPVVIECLRRAGSPLDCGGLAFNPYPAIL